MTMRIALVHMRHAPTGGTERYLNHLARHLAESGHEVHILCRRHGQAPHPEVRFERLRGLAIGKSWRMWRFAKAVEAHVAGADYDLVYGLGKTWTHDVMRLGGGLHGTYLELAHREKLAPWKRPFAGLGLRHRVALAIERRAMGSGHCRRFITNARMVGEDLKRRYGIPDERVVTVYNGVDLERFRPGQAGDQGAELRASLGWQEERVVLFLGTGYGRKGLDLVLEAWPALQRVHPQARLLVAGFDSGQTRFKARAEALGLGDRVRFLGGRRDPENVYRAADVYVLPTRYDPFANSTLEALASGLPTITSSSNGGAELLEERVQGSIVDVGDRGAAVGRIAEELVHWCSPEALAAGAVAARRLAEKHSIESKMLETERLLLGMIAQ